MALVGLIELLVVAMYLSLNHYGVEGGVNILKEEELEFKRTLDKASNKIFQADEYDIYDCVHIYEQPSFDHPLLKKHKIQMKPTTLPQGLSKGTSSVDQHNSRCREGMVPILRTRKEDLMWAKSFSNSYAANIHPHSTAVPGQHIAFLQSIDDKNIAYLGVKGDISVHNPKVEANQTSSAGLWIENGPLNEVNGIGAGWMVNLGLFADNKTRSFVQWTFNGKTACFNLICSGFVQVDKDYLVGGAMGSYSTYDGPQYDITMMIFQDQVTGNWWLIATEKSINVGYWPKALFPHLVGGAARIAWGGLVQGPPNGVSPPMGSGHFPDGHVYHTAWFRQIHIVDASYHLTDPNASKLEINVQGRKCYDLSYYGYQGKEMGHMFLFGGPGGVCGV